jgi:hypothetical protein
LTTGLQHRFGPDQGLGTDQGAGGFRLTGGILSQPKLTTLPGHIGRHDPQPAEAARYSPRLHPCPQLPSNPFGQVGLIKGVCTPPHPLEHNAGNRLCFDFHPVRRYPFQPQPIQEPMGQVARSKTGLLEVRERLLIFLFDCMVIRHKPWPGVAIFARGMPVGIQAERSEPGGHRGSRKACQFAEGGYPEPAKGCSKIITSDGSNIQRSQEGCIVGNNAGSGLSFCDPGSLMGGKGSLGNTNRRPRTGHRLYGTSHLLDERGFTAVIANRPADRHKHQTRMRHLNSWNQRFDSGHHRLEHPGLGPSILDKSDDGRTHCLGLSSQHAIGHTMPAGEGIGRHDPIRGINDLARPIRRRVQATQRPIGKPHA